MEVEMEMEMEDDSSSGGDTAVEFTFTAVEIDIDYEFDAVRFFDFTRTESIDEAREAEMWFDSVGSYPPSPFAVRLLSRGKSENDSSTLSKGFDNTHQLDSTSNVIRPPNDSTMVLNNTDADVANVGIALDLKNYSLQEFQKQLTNNSIPKDNTRNTNYNLKENSRMKPYFTRTSTLMKPTASQLAKQNQERLIDHFRFKKLGNKSSGVESQATKRQKLDGGHLFKVTDTKQQTNFIHKAPKREGIVEGNLNHGRLRITIPKPPDLATAHRAQRIRQKGDNGNANVASRGPVFRARPLNRKIFEAPSLLHQKSTPTLPEFQKFHIKTTENAVQNTPAVTSTSTQCNSLKAPKKPSLAFSIESSSRAIKGCINKHLKLTETSKPKQQNSETIHRFKALPLNKKILSSKGDIGVFRSSKRETTAFNFQTEKRAHHAPPVDLFNKLSLTSESGSRLSRPHFSKDSKENRVCTVQQQSEVSTPKPGSKQVHKMITNDIPFTTVSRNLGTC